LCEHVLVLAFTTSLEQNRIASELSHFRYTLPARNATLYL
jgi:hypothetical protein